MYPCLCIIPGSRGSSSALDRVDRHSSGPNPPPSFALSLHRYSSGIPLEATWIPGSSRVTDSACRYITEAKRSVIVSEEPPPDELLELLADEYVRAILTATTADRHSASMLADTIDAANSTVYDRLDRLLEAGLLDERTALDENGNHYATYRARLERLDLRLTDEGFVVETNVIDRDAAADQLTDLWGDLR